MNAHQLALQEQRTALLQNFNSTEDILNLWKLNYLYSLHFQGSAEPAMEAILGLMEREPTAIFFASGARVAIMWQEQQYLRQQAARLVASMLKDDHSPEGMAQALQNSIDFSLKTAESYEGFPEALNHWIFSYLLYGLTVEDVRRGYAELEDGRNAVLSLEHLALFLSNTDS